MDSKLKPQEAAALRRHAHVYSMKPSASQQRELAAMFSDPDYIQATKSLEAHMQPEDLEATMSQKADIWPGATEQERLIAMYKSPAAQAIWQNTVKEDTVEQVEEIKKLSGVGMKDPEISKILQDFVRRTMSEEEVKAFVKKETSQSSGMTPGEQLRAHLQGPDMLKMMQKMATEMDPGDLAALLKKAADVRKELKL